MSEFGALKVPEVDSNEAGLFKCKYESGNMIGPCLLKGLDIGACVSKWDIKYLSEKIGNQSVNVHVSTFPLMDFINKNFKYETMPFSELLKKCGTCIELDKSSNVHRQYCYLRTVGTDVRKEIADFNKQFPALAEDLVVPEIYPVEKYFSSVLRVSSPGTQLWTHYDIMDNILIQIKGRKRCVLFPPTDAPYLYLKGDKSGVLDIDNPDLEKYPEFAKVSRYECIMEESDILFIPAMWFHNMRALDFGIAVNVFWKGLDPKFYDKKDLYGNKDLIPAADALRHLDKAIKSLDKLPENYRNFYKYRLLNRLQTLFDKEEIHENKDS